MTLKPTHRLFALLIVILSISNVTGCIAPPPTSTPTATTMSTATAIPTEINSLTPVSAFPPLLPTESLDCQLPCWWGIHPGRTTWKEAESLLSVFSSQLKKSSDGEQMNVMIAQSSEASPSSYLSADFYAYDQVIQEIKVSGIENVPSYSLPTLLAELGSPTEVWIHTFSSFVTAEKTPFVVLLLYRQRGILAQYDTDSAEFDRDLIRACAADLATIRVLRLWNSQVDLSMAELMKEFEFGFDGSLLISTDALGLDTQAFTKAYANVDHPCFVTSREKWVGIDGLPYHP